MLHVFCEDHLALLQDLGQLGVSLLLLRQQGFGAGILLGYHALHFQVYLLGGVFAIWALETIFVLVIIAQVGQLVAHAHVGYHAVGLLGDALEVVHSTRGHMTREQFLGGTSAQGGTHLVEHLLLGGYLSLLGQIPRCSQGTAAGHYGDLHQGVGILQVPAHRGMTCLVQGDGVLLLLGHHLGLLFQTADDAVHGGKEIFLTHCAMPMAGGYQRSLVAHVRYVGTREAWCLTREEVDIQVVGLADGAQVHLEDGLALRDVGQVYVYLSVEAARTQQGLVQDVGTVGGGKDDDTAIGAETIHLGEQLVERILALVVATHAHALTTGTTHGVYLVDEDDARALFLGLVEEVAHTACTDTHEHLHEVRTAHREEGHVCLAGHGLGQQGLTCARRAHQQCSLGNLASQFGIFCGILQKVHYLLHLLFGALLSGHVLERNLGLVFVDEACTALAHAEDAHGSATATFAARTSTTAHSAHEEEPEEEEQQHGPNVQEEAPPGRILFVVVTDIALEGACGTFHVEEVVQLIGTGVLCCHMGLLPHEALVAREHVAIVLGQQFQHCHALALVGHHRLAIALADIVLKLGVGDFLVCVCREVLATSHEEEVSQHAQDAQVHPGEVEASSLLLIVFLVCHQSRSGSSVRQASAHRCSMS